MKGINFFKLVLFSLFSSSLIIGCNKTIELSDNSLCRDQIFICLHDKKVLEVITNKGSFELEIDGRFSPVTAGNFLDLVKKGFYNKTIFTKVVKDPKPFIVESGVIQSRPNHIKGNSIKGLNYIDPRKGFVRYIPLEISLKDESIPRYNQLIPSQIIKRINLPHKKGSISMSRSQTLDSASAQFYISLRDLPELDGRYAVFGTVINGLDVLELIEEGDQIIMIKNTGNI